jgi:MFS superfamily sulfate permease-like transporter
MLQPVPIRVFGLPRGCVTCCLSSRMPDRLPVIPFATLLCGVLQIGAGYLKLGHLMRFVSRSLVTGFINGLARWSRRRSGCSDP